MRRLTSAGLLLLLLAGLLQSSVADAQVSFASNRHQDVSGIPLELLLNKLESRFKVRFNYATEMVREKSVKAENLNGFNRFNIDKVLNQSIASLGLYCKKISEGNYALVASSRVFTPLPQRDRSVAVLHNAVLQKVSGWVKDSTGAPLAGVTIGVKNTKNATTSNAEGYFQLQNVEESAILVLSFVGYSTTELPVNGQEQLNIVLAVASSQMEQVVVTAMGIKRQEKALGYAVQRVSGNAVQTVKGVDLGTSLTGQVAGLVVKNSTEFFAKPTLELRGEGVLLVVDGVPYGNMTLRDIPTDDIESMDVLKGPTASALYGSRASGGVLLVTTKKGSGGKGIAVNINSNTMLQTGFLAIPKVQGSYGRGTNGAIDNDYVWGPKLDIGETATDWNPETKQFEENRPLRSIGKNNLKNFMETGVVTNNNISLSQSSEYGSFRASLNHIYNKGQFPNARANMFNFTLGGEVKAGKKFTLESHVGVARRYSPQVWGSGYNNQGYIYQLTMWTGPEYDIRQYRDYWKTPYQGQNWLYTNWYDNPYLIAYEKLWAMEQNTINANITSTYKFTDDLKLLVRIGYDVYSNKETATNPTASIFSTRGGWNARGRYTQNATRGWSTNDDVMLTWGKKINKWDFDLMAGGTIYYWVDEGMNFSTKNGLTAPTYFSIAGSVEPPTITPSYSSRQVNSLYGKATVGWNNAVFFDFTGRNDWNSSQPKSQRDYFYPSLGTSVVLSDLLPMPSFVNMWKLRGSWATFKTPAEVYEINRLYTTTNAAWNTLNSASYPSNLLGSPDLLPTSMRTWEIGTAAYLFNKRLHVDVAYFNKYYYNQKMTASIPASSGFSSTLVTSDETLVRKGVEITLGGTIINNRKFQWQSVLNWATQHRYYVDLDSTYTPKSPWITPGARRDIYTDYYWQRDPSGNVIHNNGMPLESQYVTKYGYIDPKFSFGFINNFSLGNFQFGLNIDGRVGGLMYNYVYDKMFDTGTNPETDNQYRYDEVVNGKKNYVGQGVKVVSGSVTYDNFGNIVSDDRKYAANDVEVSYQDYAQNFRGGDMGVQNKSFVKVREVSAGYRFPAKMLSKTSIKSASVALTAQNLFLFTNFKFSDPDVDLEDLNSPSQRMVGINFKLGF